MIFDVTIVGGGIAGCSAALHLRKRGLSVVLLERGLVGSQASGVNYGGVRQQGRHPAELPVAKRSSEIWRDLKPLIGDDCEFAPSGHLKLARNATQAAELEAYAILAKDFGLTLELIGRRELRSRYPFLGDDVVAGSHCAEDGQANPRLLTPTFARAARAAGADIREHAEVIVAKKAGGLFDVRLADKQAVRSRMLLNTAGAWGSIVASWFDESVPEEVLAPNMCVTEPIDYFLKPNLGVCGGDIYIRQIERGNVIFGSGEGVADRNKIKARPLAEVTANAAALAIELVPRLRHAQLIRTWSGIEGRTPDMLPVLSPSSTTSGLFHAFGFSGHGFQLGPAVGAILSDLAADGRTDTPIAPFTIARFASAETQKTTAA